MTSGCTTTSPSFSPAGSPASRWRCAPTTTSSCGLYRGTSSPSDSRAALGLARTFQINTLCPNLTATENVLLAVQGTTPTKLRLHRPIESYRHLYERAAHLLDSVGLAGKGSEMVRTLSHGEQRQLEI